MWLHLIRNDNASLEELVHAFRQSLHWWITEKFQSIQLLHLVDEKWPNVAHLVLILQTLWYIWKQGKSFSWVEKNTFFFINVTNDNDFVGQYLHDQRYRSRGGGRSFNPIQTRRVDYPHHITTVPPQIFGRCSVSAQRRILTFHWDQQNLPSNHMIDEFFGLSSISALYMLIIFESSFWLPC